jgi:transcriptional regulator with XRE-family HTH domain
VVPVNEDLGVVLRKARRERNLSLRVVAEKLGISTSLLSQVENGKTHPSVKTLFGLASVLGISLDELVQADSAASAADVQRAAQRVRDERAGIARREDNPVLEMEKGVRWERLATGGISGLQSLFVTYAAGATSSADGRSMRHQGTEFAYLLEGVLRLRLEFDEYELRAGDSFCFDSARPHLYFNAGTEPATGIWLMFDPAGLANPQAASPAAFGGLLSHSPAVFENSEPPATT